MADEQEMIDEKAFKCPECGSPHFGTGNLDTDNPFGHCHGYLPRGDGRLKCAFTWPRSEDEKYFHSTGKQVPKDQKAEVVWPTPGEKDPS